jgi:hypothetical protein
LLSGVYIAARNYQKFSDDLSGHFSRLSANFGLLQDSRELERRLSMAKQTTIRIETDSLLILRSRSSTRAWCPLCAAEVETIVLEDTRVISNLEQPALEQWLNAGELHRSQAADGSALICLNSLLARVQNTKIS